MPSRLEPYGGESRIPAVIQTVHIICVTITNKLSSCRADLVELPGFIVRNEINTGFLLQKYLMSEQQHTKEFSGSPESTTTKTKQEMQTNKIYAFLLPPPPKKKKKRSKIGRATYV